MVAGAVRRRWWGGGRVLVVRPGVLCGDSASGASNLNDAVSMMLCGMVLDGVTCTVDPRSPLPQRHNLLPVDAAAAAIASLAAPPPREPARDDPPVYHLCAPASLPLSTLVAWVRAAGHPLAEVSAEEFCRGVRAVPEGHPLFALKPMLGRPLGAAATALSSAPEPQARLREAAFGGLPRGMTADGLARALAHLLPPARKDS